MRLSSEKMERKRCASLLWRLIDLKHNRFVPRDKFATLFAQELMETETCDHVTGSLAHVRAQWDGSVSDARLGRLVPWSTQEIAAMLPLASKLCYHTRTYIESKVQQERGI